MGGGRKLTSAPWIACQSREPRCLSILGTARGFIIFGGIDAFLWHKERGLQAILKQNL